MSRRQEAAGAATREQLRVLALASLASFMVILDMLVVATALTAIRAHLGASLADLEWTVTAYTISFAVLLMTAAALGDRLGRRRVFAAGLVLFAAASAACALATSTGALVAARAVQGAGAAAIMPTGLALLNGAFPPARRGWQWIFWLNVPIALGAVPLVLARVAEATGPGGTVDVPGLALVTVAALGLTWGLVRGYAAGWASAETTAAFAA